MRLRSGLISATLAWATLTQAMPQPDSGTTITVPASITLTLPTLWPTEDADETETIVDRPDAVLWTASTTHVLSTASTRSTSALAANYTWNPFDGGCDAASEKPEDCRATTNCDTDNGEYPICRHGECVCRQTTCAKDSDCAEESICREDDHYAVCMPDPYKPDVKGLCACKPLVVGCGNQENPQTYCSDQLDCTINKRVFSLWSEFGQCLTGHPEGQCICQTIQCPFDNNGTRGDEYCKEYMTCPEEAEVACKVQWLAPPNDLGGYCTCAAGPYEPWDPEH